MTLIAPPLNHAHTTTPLAAPTLNPSFSHAYNKMASDEVESERNSQMVSDGSESEEDDGLSVGLLGVLGPAVKQIDSKVGQVR